MLHSPARPATVRPRGTRSGRLAALLIAVLVLTSGCGAVAEDGPSTYAANLREDRPVVDLSFDLAPSLDRVAGRERVVFTPDLPVCELVFRAWPNKPTMADGGTELRVDGAAVDGRPAVPWILPAGAPEGVAGTLVELPLAECAPPGRPITADLVFTLTLGEDVNDRVGFSHSSEMAWWATGFPLLAWVRGEGWAREDAVSIPGETATSEDFRLRDLTVTAPAGLEVLGTGTRTGTSPGPVPGTTTHRFRAEAVRNAAVTVGRLDVVEREVSGVRVHLGTPLSGTEVPPQEWLGRVEQYIDRLSEFVGPFPYPELWISVIPAQSSGLEFPSALQFGDLGLGELDGLVAHELAHQWFYGLVGNNQARDPWLDESFSTLAQAVATERENDYVLADIPAGHRGDIGRSMNSWGYGYTFDRYLHVVYDQGAAVLLEARRRAGEDRFDDALRAYVTENAHRVAAPEDVATAFEDLPEVRALLIENGALPS
ncbi:M1 family aminopeptidase [Actinomycetospora lemnae]|uniref:M1 family aminopeptidase n=1 Tax=Actinomycetospora lemnae TaxID=3019891 RepID=A0ABT5T076_9PSEU|nr:M1 family aminopeptidase [Actinomycetospora sp. DW7H6]MDD7967786.1 M1 family aminopeptidase [Actinomycetospora sp. DW7H6]